MLSMQVIAVGVVGLVAHGVLTIASVHTRVRL
jgi:hypothetical protein